LGGLHDCLLRGGSAERKRKDFHVQIKKLDLELAIGDGLRLPDKLVQPLLRVTVPLPCSSTSLP
jgi:hypothetical protein